MLCIPTTPLQLQVTTLQKELSEEPCRLSFIKLTNILFYVLILQQFLEKSGASQSNQSQKFCNSLHHFSNMQTFNQLQVTILKLEFYKYDLNN